MNQINTMKLAVIAVLTFVGIVGGVSHLQATAGRPSEMGAIRVQVRDEAGVSIKNADVYVSDHQKILHVLKSDALGMVSVDLQKGEYTVASTLSKPQVDYIDRYASPTASIFVDTQDTTSVVLILRSVADPIADLSLSALQKIGVADEIAKYTN